MEELIKNLYPMNRCLLGEGYDNAVEYLKHLIDLEVISIPSGTKFKMWEVPDEWVVVDAWVKFKGKKIINYKKQPLSLVVGSLPFSGVVTLEELKKHINCSADKPDATYYSYLFYERTWGFSMPLNDVILLEEGDYEVHIDTRYQPGNMKLAVHTIKGNSEREILLFAHLDHPYQANDNLSAVACLVDLSKRIKAEHTIKIIFCPETIGSIAYCETQDISKVDAVIAVDVCGNDNLLTVQKAFDRSDRINAAADVALKKLCEDYRKGDFRALVGSDEYYFNDPKVGIPGIMLTTLPYNEYHTSDDTPEIICYSAIEKTRDVVIKIIETYERDYLPERLFSGPVMRSRFGIQASQKQKNLMWDYFFYNMDGKRYLSDLCVQCGIDFDDAIIILNKMKDEKLIRSASPSEVGQ